MQLHPEQTEEQLTDRTSRALLVIGAEDVEAVLGGREMEIMNLVREAYASHARGQSSLPHSSFLRFPDQVNNRIIALPAYLAEPFSVAGIKWIASFPGNHDKRLDRASAVIVLNSITTGRPEALLEGSVISAKRTAASAALAAQYLHPNQGEEIAGFVGCGLINFEIARFLMCAFGKLNRFVLFDTSKQNAEVFRERCRSLGRPLEIEIATSLQQLLQTAPLLSFATTAAQPHLDSIPNVFKSTTLLHISLRDISPGVIVQSDNVVDDVDHVCRAQTSLDLARQSAGHMNFIRATLGEVILGRAASRDDSHPITIFSPFGLGILDLALSQFALNEARVRRLGLEVPSFLPQSWMHTNAR